MKAHGTCLEDIQSRKCWICATATSLSRNHDAATQKKNQIHNSYFEQFCVGTIFSLYRAIYTWKGVWLCILRIMLAFCTMCVLLSTSSHHIHLRGGLKPSETERSPRSSARKRVELSYRLMWRSSRIYRFSS